MAAVLAVLEVLTEEKLKMKKTKRKNISQPHDWWLAFEAAARADGRTLSAWIGECCVECIPDSAQAEMSERLPVGRPTKPAPEAP